MPVNWKDPKAFERLLAAMVAAQEMKLDYRKIASMYGEGATYDAIEGRFRIIKKEAAKLLAEVESGQRPAAPPRGNAMSKSSSFATTSTDDNDSISTPKKPRKPRSTTTTPRAKKSTAAGGGGGDKVGMAFERLVVLHTCMRGREGLSFVGGMDVKGILTRIDE